MTAAIIMLVITIVLFFLFDIRHIFGRIFGFSERKEIKRLRNNTAFTSQLNNKYNQKMKGQVFTDTGSLKKKQTPAERLGIAPVSNQNNKTPDLQDDNSMYRVEDGSKLTTVLSSVTESTGIVGQAVNSDEIQTTLLSRGDINAPPDLNLTIPNVQFTIIRQIIMTHTEETIEI
jgi:hypothetical protein